MTTTTSRTRRRSSRARLAGAALIATAALASPAAAATGPASASTNATTDQPATVTRRSDQPRPRFEVVSSPSFEGQSALGPDNRQKKHPTNQRPFDDVDVRKAVTAGFDRRATNPTP